MAGVKVLGFTVIKSNAEREIQALYEEHQRVLQEQKQKLYDDITEWGDALIQSIHKHASLQKYYLEQEFSKQMHELNETYKIFTQDLHVREQMKNVEEIDQLLVKFKKLKYELSTLEVHPQSTPYIRLPGNHKLSFTKPDGFDDAEIGKNQINNSSTEKGDNEDNSYVIVNRSPRQSLSHQQQTRRAKRSFSSISSASNGNPSKINNPDSESTNEKDDGAIKKCPVCFMIFPQTMQVRDRIQHVHEHYANE